MVLNWPDKPTPTKAELTLMSPKPQDSTKVFLLGYGHDPLPWKYVNKGQQGITIMIPTIPFNQMPCDYAWAFRMINLVN